jgi:hypothetical protein
MIVTAKVPTPHLFISPFGRIVQIELLLRPLLPGRPFDRRQDLVWGNSEAADVEILIARLGGVLGLQGACNCKADGCYCGCAESDRVVLWYMYCCGRAGDVEAEGAMLKTTVVGQRLARAD